MHGFAALGDPTRRRIVEMLATRELPAGEIARRFDMTAPAVSPLHILERLTGRTLT